MGLPLRGVNLRNKHLLFLVKMGRIHTGMMQEAAHEVAVPNCVMASAVQVGESATGETMDGTGLETTDVGTLVETRDVMGEREDVLARGLMKALWARGWRIRDLDGERIRDPRCRKRRRADLEITAGAMGHGVETWRARCEEN